MSKQLNFEDSSKFLINGITSDEPFAAGKIGVNELKCVYEYVNKFWNAETLKALYINNGIFPPTDEMTNVFIKEFVKSIPNIDALPLWTPFNPVNNPANFEKSFINTVNKNCTFIEVRSLEPYYSDEPWTQYLENKKVLIISPFVESIQKQYNKKELIWKDQRILPDFELKTLKHQLSPALGIPSKYSSWIEMITDLKKQISLIDFDVALVGASGSSLPLVSYCKKIGKKAVHLGGGLQILFGITGTRWDNKPHINQFYNENWVKPSAKETPKDFLKLENGCYW
jgi:hypothetical protein